jgi:hypothetical protein
MLIRCGCPPSPWGRIKIWVRIRVRVKVRVRVRIEVGLGLGLDFANTCLCCHHESWSGLGVRKVIVRVRVGS